jgi:virulence-associated protein VagC
MTTAKIFRSRNCQAVQLPKEFRVGGKELVIYRRGDEISLREKTAPMARAFELLAGLPGDLTIADRKNDRPQTRTGMRLKKGGKR